MKQSSPSKTQNDHTSFLNVAPKLIADYYHVKLDYMSNFSLRSLSDGKEDPAEVTVSRIENLKRSFIPNKRRKNTFKKSKWRKALSHTILQLRGRSVSRGPYAWLCETIRAIPSVIPTEPTWNG